jgi:Tfp pilus assembly protein PilN
MMLVEINLLPQKEPKKVGFIITLSSLLVVFFLIGGFYFWQTQSAKDELASLDRQISITKKIADKEQKNSETAASSSSINQLKSAINWANDYPIQTVPVMQHLTSLLPERGFIQSFGYSESGTVTLTVQFDSAREAAYFLDSLNQSKWIAEASLNSLAATESKNETNAAGNSAVSNRQGDTTNPTSNANQSTPGSTTTVDSQNHQATGTITNQGTQTNPAAGTTNQDSRNNTSTTTNQNTVNNNTASSPISSPIKQKSNYLPRYTGQFEIKFNKEEMKKIIQKSKKDGEGVKGS